MDRKILYQSAICTCFLLTLPSLVFAADSSVTDNAVEEVTVYSTPLEKYLVTTTVITDKDIEAKGAHNLADALEDVAGLNFHQGKKAYKTVDIRGSQITYTKIYIDGVFVNPLAKVSSSAGVDLKMIPVDNIAKIEIIKGPAPVPYGTDAIGGIILITTKNGMDKPGGRVSVVGGSNDTLNGSVAFGGGNEKFNYYFDVGAVHNGGYGAEPNNSLKQQFINSKLNWKFKDGSHLSFVGDYSTTDQGQLNGVDPATGNLVSSTTGFWPGLKNWQFKDWNKGQLSLDYGKMLNNKLDVDVKVYRYTESQSMWAYGPDYDRAVVPANGRLYLNNGIVYSSYNSSTNTYSSPLYSTTGWNMSRWSSFLNGAEVQNNWKVNSEHTLTLGTMWNNIGFKTSSQAPGAANPSDPNNYIWSAQNNQRLAYYLQDSITPNDKTTYTLGVRYDRNTVTDPSGNTNIGSAVDPTVNAVFRLDDRNTLRASYGKTCSFPLLQQFFANNQFVANPGLQPERANNYEIGFKHLFDASTTGDIAFFQNDITNRIARISIANNKMQWVNLNWAKIKGVELNLKKNFDSRWNGFFNYTYLDTAASYNYGVAQLAYTPRNHIEYGLDYKPDKQYTISFTGHWVVSDRYTDDASTYTPATGSKAATDNRSNQQVIPYLSGYHTFDFQVKRQVNAKQDWYFQVNNIFDKQYDDELFYPAVGRTVMVGMDFFF